MPCSAGRIKSLRECVIHDHDTWLAGQHHLIGGHSQRDLRESDLEVLFVMHPVSSMKTRKVSLDGNFSGGSVSTIFGDGVVRR